MCVSVSQTKSNFSNLPFSIIYTTLHIQCCLVHFQIFSDLRAMGRAPCCDKANVKRGPWSPEEDETLKNYLKKHGTGGNWITLPQKAGLYLYIYLFPFSSTSLSIFYFSFLRPKAVWEELSSEMVELSQTSYQAWRFHR